MDNAIYSQNISEDKQQETNFDTNYIPEEAAQRKLH